jgi:hypothetical protein
MANKAPQSKTIQAPRRVEATSPTSHIEYRNYRVIPSESAQYYKSKDVKVEKIIIKLK